MQFTAPLDPENPEAEINYDYKSMPENDDLLKHGEDQMYAYKQCLKICDYVQKVHCYEVL